MKSVGWYFKIINLRNWKFQTSLSSSFTRKVENSFKFPLMLAGARAVEKVSTFSRSPSRHEVAKNLKILLREESNWQFRDILSRNCYRLENISSLKFTLQNRCWGLAFALELKFSKGVSNSWDCCGFRGVREENSSGNMIKIFSVERFRL